MTKVITQCRPIQRHKLDQDVINALLLVQKWINNDPKPGASSTFPIIVGWEVKAARTAGGDTVLVFRLSPETTPYEPIEQEWLHHLVGRHLSIDRAWNGAGLNTFSIALKEALRIPLK